MKRFIIGLVLLVISFGFVMAQIPQEKPYSYTLTKEKGYCLFTGKSLDDVWEATINALSGMGYRIPIAAYLHQEKIFKWWIVPRIAAFSGPSPDDEGYKSQNPWTIILTFEKRETGIGVINNWPFASKLDETLYTPLVKTTEELYKRMGKLLYQR